MPRTAGHRRPLRADQGHRRAADAARAVAALGFDGKWVLHPGQVDVVNEIFSPSPEDYQRAVAILDAYEKATSQDARGAVMLGEEMIDEASRKMALRMAALGKGSRPGQEPVAAPSRPLFS